MNIKQVTTALVVGVAVAVIADIVLRAMREN